MTAWNVDAIGAPALWTNGFTGEGVVVAVIDTGCDVAHGLLDQSVIDARSVYSNGDASDSNGHGTHVAHTVLQIAPGAKLLIIKAIGDRPSAAHVNLAIRRAIDWRGPAGERVSIINMSFSGSTYSDYQESLLREAVDAGILPIAAGGNDGDGDAATDEILYPASYPPVMAVAAVDSAGRSARISSSNPEIDIAAPGVGIVAAAPGGGTASMSGTSMAAPHVSGAAALVIQAFRQTVGRDPAVAEVRELLSRMVYKPGDYDARAYGAGVLRLDYAALMASLAGYIEEEDDGMENDDLPEIQQAIGVTLNGAAVPGGGYLINGTSYVPVRFIAETFGAAVAWDGQSAHITKEAM